MAIQMLPILKAIAPYIAQVATVAIPAFTSRKEEPKTDVIEESAVVSKQIEELQAAASQNAKSLHLLAENLQQAMQEIEASAREAEKKVTTYRILVISSFSLSLASIATCAYLIFL
jgi:hypothetical protein